MKDSAVLFPGQGAQYPGMGKDFFERYPRARKLFLKADALLQEEISKICFSSPEVLKQTLYQQVAIFLVSVIIYEVVKDKDILKKPRYFAGLSLGEYTSLYATGVLSFEDGLFLVKKRAEAMERAARNNPSCMLAVIGLPKTILEEEEKNLYYIANINSPQQIVLSLSLEKLKEVQEFLKKKGAKRVVQLEVSGGFHSLFMKEAEEELRLAIEKLKFNPPHTPIVSNVDARPHTGIEEIKNNLIRQLTSPVKWLDSIEFLRREGITLFYEVGPSRVLKGILRKIEPSLEVVNFGKVEDLALTGERSENSGG